MDYKLNDVIEELETSAKEALKDGGTSNWGHRTLQVVEWLKDYKRLKEQLKGHGRLIDADALDLEKEVSMADDWKTAHEIANCVKYAPTIIEADKENDDEN